MNRIFSVTVAANVLSDDPIETDLEISRGAARIIGDGAMFRLLWQTL